MAADLGQGLAERRPRGAGVGLGKARGPGSVLGPRECSAAVSGVRVSVQRSAWAAGRPDSPPPPPTELESQTDLLFPANASAPSGEHVRRTLAEVERLLGAMRARDLGAPRAAAEAELEEAQRCEWLQVA